MISLKVLADSLPNKINSLEKVQMTERQKKIYFKLVKEYKERAERVSLKLYKEIAKRMSQGVRAKRGVR